MLIDERREHKFRRKFGLFKQNKRTQIQENLKKIKALLVLFKSGVGCTEKYGGYEQ
jgi:hypothetical protein